ncbi:MAG TPA: PspC domain-containing protein [Actinomycetes bacterium]|nr:PspC domain-containing protein [Actinomycetes bacterium]
MSTDETTAPPQGPPPGYASGAGALPPIATLRRSRTDRKLAGVAGGLGRYAGVDPLILRILFVVLTIFGGSGILLYVAGWLLIADDGEEESQAQRIVRGHTDGSTVSTVVFGSVVLILGLVFMGAVLDTGPGLGGLGALVVVAVIVLLLLRNGQRPAAGTPGQVPYGPVPPPVPATGPGAFGQTTGTAYTAPTVPVPPGPTAPVPPGAAVPPPPPVPPRPPQPPRERSVLGVVTFCSVLVVVGLMLLWNVANDGSADDFRAVAVFGTALGVTAIGLLVGAVVGRARGLIVLGVLLALATTVAAATDQRLSGGVGERDWTPQTAAAAERPHRLGIGDALLDLTQVPPGSTVDTDVRVGVGSLTVLVPSDAEVTVDAEVGAGHAMVFDQEDDGTDVDVTASTEPRGGPSGTVIKVDAEVGLGEVRVEQR